MIRKRKQNVTVGIADGDSRYHASLLPLSIRSQTPFRFYDTGRDALRKSMTERNSFWLISLDLPDMTGFDLFEMLSDKLGNAPVCLVGHAYRPEDELRAYRAGAAMYACKPVEQSWLWQSLCRLRKEIAKHEPVMSEVASEEAPLSKGNVSSLTR